MKLKKQIRNRDTIFLGFALEIKGAFSYSSQELLTTKYFTIDEGKFSYSSANFKVYRITPNFTPIYIYIHGRIFDKQINTEITDEEYISNYCWKIFLQNVHYETLKQMWMMSMEKAQKAGKEEKLSEFRKMLELE